MEKILVTQAVLPPLEEYVREIGPLWESHWITNMGEKHEELRERLKEYLEVPELELFTNGHMALELTIQALGLTGEVITTPFTFASTTHAIVRNGLTPVFCDIEPETYTLDAAKLEALITEKTSAILPVHVYGNICAIEEIDRIAKKHGLKVLYDAAHAFGETYRGTGIGSFGDASCFSFHATKVFNTIEGGATAFCDTVIAERLYDLKNFGIHGPVHVTGIGANAKMNEFCAAMGLCNLRYLEDNIAKRKRIFERYYARLERAAGIKLNPVQSEVKSNYAYFPIVIEEVQYGRTREELCAALEAKGIFPRKYFYPLTNEFECYQGRFDTKQTPVAERISRQVLTLPMYADLSLEDVDRICDVILS